MSCKTSHVYKDHCRPINNILIIEDSKSLSDLIKTAINTQLSLHCDTALTEDNAKSMIARKRYDLILVDLFLPDSTGNFIGWLIRHNMRVIVMTAQASEKVYTDMSKVALVDFIAKSNHQALVRYIIKSMTRLRKNKDICIMVCDDSKTARRHLIEIIKRQNFQYIEAQDGQDVLKCISNNTLTVHLIVTDYQMPKLNGIEMTRKIREFFSEEQLPIIAVSASSKKSVLTQFLQAGANDFIMSPYTDDEFVARLNVTANQLYFLQENNRLIAKLEENNTKDYLTKLYNRRYFYQYAPHLVEHVKRNNETFALIMLDIDHFKSINDSYGHNAGDEVLRHIASLLLKNVRSSSFIFRWGGEEFLILEPNTKLAEARICAERIRASIENSSITLDKATLSVTASLGIATGSDNIEVLINTADDKLYEAKRAGRNRIES